MFGLHVPHRLQAADPDARQRLTDAVLESLNSVLAEPIQDVILTDAHGRPCIEAKTTVDLEAGLGLTGGNIFHGALGWPFAEDDDPLDTPARQWGVATARPDPFVRLRFPSRRRSLRDRRAQCRNGRTGGTVMNHLPWASFGINLLLCAVG